MDARDWAELHIVTGYRTDVRGRLIVQNRPDFRLPAPPVHLARSRDGNVWRLRHDIPRTIAARLNELLAAEPVVDHFAGNPPACGPSVSEALRPVATKAELHGGPAYHFPAEISEASATAPTRDELLRRFPDFVNDDFERIQPCLIAYEGSEAAAICHSARRTVDACAAGVETVEQLRRRGHGSTVVAAWAQAVRDSGREPLYSTAWDNLASQAVARRLGLVFDADEWTWD